MINALPGRPIRNNVSRTLERFHTYLLVVLGVAFIGTGIHRNRRCNHFTRGGRRRSRRSRCCRINRYLFCSRWVASNPRGKERSDRRDLYSIANQRS
jgi:hypothetical protein